MTRSRKQTFEPSALEHFATGILIVGAAVFVSWLIHDSALMRHLEMTNLDVLFLSQKPATSSNIVAVEITDDDYTSKELFGGRSPLDVAKVQDLIAAVALSGAKVIAVDLDTSEWTAQARNAVYRHLGQAHVAWARGGWEEKNAIHLDNIQDTDTTHCFGVPASIPDEYGVVRGYLPAVVVNGKAIPNLARVAAELFAHPEAGCPEAAGVENTSPEEALVNYAGGRASFDHLTAATVLGAVKGEAWRTSNPLQSKIVILGGSYRAARDKYVTPVGYLDGEDILAHTILSLSGKGRIREVGEKLFLTLDFLIGMLLITITWFLPRTWALLITFIAIPLLSLSASFLVYNSLGYFASFVPVLCGVFLHEVIEHEVEDWRTRRELKKLA